MTSFMGDPYVLVGTVMAILAGAILMTRRPKNDAHQKKLNDEMLKIGEQMKMYKQATAATATATATATAMSLQTSIDGGSFSSNKKTIDDDLDLNIFPGGRILILFGSQTGTAEGFAQTLAKEGRTHGFSTFSKDLEKFNHEKELFLSNDIKKELKVPLRVIFIMATYGEGDPTDNAISFVNFLKNKNFFLETKKSFNHIFFTVFGLGNRQYEHFNATGRFVDQQFEKFGGKRMYPYGEGDDDGCIEEDFDEWKENLWKQLQIKFQISLKEKQKNNEQKSLEEECSTNFILTTTYVIKKIKTPKKISRSMEEEEEE
jgi:NADPH-ferrihemoprotein reductase